MSLKSALIALAGNVGKCQENARSLKLELERGLLEVAGSATGSDDPVDATILWTNSAPTTAFGATVVKLEGVAKTDYKAYAILFAPGAPSQSFIEFVPASWIDDTSLHNAEQWNIVKSTGVMSAYTRPIEYKTVDDEVAFDFHANSQYEFSTYGSAGTQTTKNGNLIPQYIIGLKF